MAKRGYFITFEGTEGSGKSTQIKNLLRYLRKNKRDAVLLREPGGTVISEAIRELLLDRANTAMVANTELLLYLAARAQLIEEKIRPALGEGKVVICDRYEDSTMAYQGFGRGLSMQNIELVSRLFVRGDLKPDLTVVLDMDPAKGMKRGGRTDRIELESNSFHRKVRQGFLQLARRNPKRYMILDARGSKKEIAKTIERAVERVIS